MKGAVIRSVLVERAVLARGPNGAATVSVFGRALWSFSGQVKIDMKVVGASVAMTRTRSIRGIADPLSAQEWAFGVWDEYVAEVTGTMKRGSDAG